MEDEAGGVTGGRGPEGDARGRGVGERVGGARHALAAAKKRGPWSVEVDVLPAPERDGKGHAAGTVIGGRERDADRDALVGAPQGDGEAVRMEDEAGVVTGARGREGDARGRGAAAMGSCSTGW